MPYLVLGSHLRVSQICDRYSIVGRLPDLVLRSVAGLATVQQVTQSLIVDLYKTCCEGELGENEEHYMRKFPPQMGFSTGYLKT